jgi:transcriptional antiterminator RfaH
MIATLDMTTRWYALHVRLGFETFVQTNLQKKGYEVFVPTYISTRRVSKGAKPSAAPLFPGYVLCRFDIKAKRPVLLTPGVKSVVGAGKLPIPIDETEIEVIRRILASGVAIAPWPYVKGGERVRVGAGVLTGVTGFAVRGKRNDRLVLSISLIKSSVAVQTERFGKGVCLSVSPEAGEEE